VVISKEYDRNTKRIRLQIGDQLRIADKTLVVDFDRIGRVNNMEEVTEKQPDESDDG
jgi:hypothetical protein